MEHPARVASRPVPSRPFPSRPVPSLCPSVCVSLSEHVAEEHCLRWRLRLSARSLLRVQPHVTLPGKRETESASVRAFALEGIAKMKSMQQQGLWPVSCPSQCPKRRLVLAPSTSPKSFEPLNNPNRRRECRPQPGSSGDQHHFEALDDRNSCDVGHRFKQHQINRPRWTHAQPIAESTDSKHAGDRNPCSVQLHLAGINVAAGSMQS